MKAGFYTVAGPLARSGVLPGPRQRERCPPLLALGLVSALVQALVQALVLTVGLGASAPVQAVDGCKLLLCMAGNWRRIAPCEPTVRQALRDVARGRGWPQCGMGGNSESGNEVVPPVNCPEQYRTEVVDFRDRTIYSCPYSGVVHVAVAGRPWTRTWWALDGGLVVEWLPAARAALAGQAGAMDTRFEDDHAAWEIAERLRRAALVPPPDAGG